MKHTTPLLYWKSRLKMECFTTEAACAPSIISSKGHLTRIQKHEDGLLQGLLIC